MVEQRKIFENVKRDGVKQIENYFARETIVMRFLRYVISIIYTIVQIVQAVAARGTEVSRYASTTEEDGATATAEVGAGVGRPASSI